MKYTECQHENSPRSGSLSDVSPNSLSVCCIFFGLSQLLREISLRLLNAPPCSPGGRSLRLSSVWCWVGFKRFLLRKKKMAVSPWESCEWIRTVKVCWTMSWNTLRGSVTLQIQVIIIRGTTTLALSRCSHVCYIISVVMERGAYAWASFIHNLDICVLIDTRAAPSLIKSH